MDLMRKYWMILALLILLAITAVFVAFLTRQQIPPKSIFVLGARL